MPLEHLVAKGHADQVRGQAPDFHHFLELDFFEATNRPLPEYVGTVHDWFGRYRETCPPRLFCKVSASFDNTPGVIPSDTDWRQWHHVGAVWIPATRTRRGSLQYFFDGRPIARPFTWEMPPGEPPLPREGDPYLFSILDRQHMVLIFGSTLTPIRVRAITVRQRDGRHNRMVRAERRNPQVGSRDL